MSSPGPSQRSQVDDALYLRIGEELDYVRRMRASGYTTLTASDYVEMRIHGVTPTPGPWS